MTKSRRVLLLGLFAVLVALALADGEKEATDSASKSNTKIDAYRTWLLENGARMDNLEFTKVARHGITVSPPQDLKVRRLLDWTFLCSLYCPSSTDLCLIYDRSREELRLPSCLRHWWSLQLPFWPPRLRNTLLLSHLCTKLLCGCWSNATRPNPSGNLLSVSNLFENVQFASY